MIGTLIIKRDGRLEKWNSDKIESAVTRALMATDPGRDLSEAEDITTTVADQLEHLLEHIPEISFSDLHDLVEVELMKYDPHAAKNYIIYRKNHNDIRETKDALLTTIDSIAKETSKDNGNVRNSPSAKIYEIGSAASNWYADTKVLEEEAAKAHYGGHIHIHDKNFYTLTYNCLVVPLEKMLKDGFRMPNGWINEPKRIGSASSLCAVIVQSIQGQGGPLLA